MNHKWFSIAQMQKNTNSERKQLFLGV